MDMIKNRLEKNLKKLKPWAERLKIEAYRLYDRDIPEYPFIVDVYKDHYVIYDKTDYYVDMDKQHLPHVIEAVKHIFKCSDEKIVIKKRERQEGLNQYEKLTAKNETMTIRESQAFLKVNLYDYLDTGLFLDHRPMRQKVFKTAKDKKFLNLFCYTGSVSVFAALGGARTTSIDMSQTYLRWAQDNFELNQIDTSMHSFINENVIEWLRRNQGAPAFDMIFLDPPTFSNSKKMSESFDVERDQDFLVESCMSMLQPDGVLYFSNNKRKFKISANILSKYKVKDITEESIPQDFHDKKIHVCFEIKNK
ncbi:class I SAM-dependent methyltransferase [Bdellovibrio svalbardensis]|uniref:Class I SAM-dependent methyltransferase n=1 Tax=Bdellovibrio svalbardensis TaxID=2972972 RepID=A0ABT6DEE2_9BACT|nr:class I SAM-dependent methyltransferase [Bdellovibrio svalbardensis]MDG0815197.1 class I SAM-dependent methyltransferase [Bdellovibrio svalbardensis]